jgi:hypothetical protein
MTLPCIVVVFGLHNAQKCCTFTQVVDSDKGRRLSLRSTMCMHCTIMNSQFSSFEGNSMLQNGLAMMFLSRSFLYTINSNPAALQTTATMDHVDPPNYLNLPSTATFLANRLNSDVGIDQIAHHICVICQDELEPNQIRRSGQTDDDDGNYTVVSVPPCNHIFHFHCIREWLHSNVITRYRCPICRTPLCRRNASSPAHEAEQLSRSHARDPDWHPVRYEALLVYVDEQIARQPLGDAADYCAIPRAVADWWYRNGNQTISTEHARTGLHHIEYEAVRRIDDVLRTMDDVSVLRQLQLHGMGVGMSDAMNELYGPAGLRIIDNVDDLDGGAAAQEQHAPANERHGMQLLLQAVEPDLQMPAPDVRTLEEHLQAMEDDHRQIMAEHYTIQERMQALNDSQRAAQLLVDHDAYGDDDDDYEDDEDEDDDNETHMSDAE